MPNHLASYRLRAAGRRPLAIWTAAVCGALSAGALAADEVPHAEGGTIVVTGERGVTVSDDVRQAPASSSVLSQDDLADMTITTYGDMFRGMTGVAVSEYNEGLLSYGVQTRGFSGGHGAATAVYVDGMPINVTGAQHTNGYMDLVMLIPELLERVEFNRGPFSIYAGNHAVAGSIQFAYADSVRSAFRASIDNFGRGRLAPAFGTSWGGGDLILAADLVKGDSYTRQSDLEQANLFAKYSFPLGAGRASLRLQSYDGEAEAPGYVDLASIENGTLSRRTAIIDGFGTEKQQNVAVLNYRSDDAEGRAGGLSGGWHASVYFNDEERKAWYNYDITVPATPEDPLTLDWDRQDQYGFDLHRISTFDVAGMESQLVLGVQFNDEAIHGVQHQLDQARSPLSGDYVSVDRDIDTRTSAFYTQVQVAPLSRLKLTAGVRYDRLAFDIDLHPADDLYAEVQPRDLAQVSETVDQWSPKFGAVVVLLELPAHRLELYGNAARGVKSPYPVRDYYQNLSVSDAPPTLKISTVQSYEAGLQGGTPDGRLGWRATYWETRQEHESGRNSVGVYESFRETDRDGFDLEASLQVRPGLRLYANYSDVDGRSRNPVNPAEPYITGVYEYLATLGADLEVDWGPHRLDLSLEGTRMGPKAINRSRTVETDAFTRYVGRAAYEHASWSGANLFLSMTAYDEQFEETKFNFGGLAVSPRPSFRALIGVEVPF